jgi:hypothetical protein
MKHIRARAAQWGVLSVLCLPHLAQAYNVNVHYQVTEFLAESCGVPYPKLIAWADARVDRDDNTRPEWPFDFSARATFHFRVTLTKPVRMRSFGDVVTVQEAEVFRGSHEAAAIVDKAIAYEYSDPVLFGIGLHAYQDSWAHEGYEFIWGHLSELRLPDNPEHDEAKALEMAEFSWEKIDAWSRVAAGRACQESWPEVRDQVRTLLASPPLASDDGVFSPGVSLKQAQGDFNFWADQLLNKGFVPREK